MNLNEEQARAILHDIMHDQHLGEAGYRNDMMVDACIAAVTLDMEQEDLESQVSERIESMEVEACEKQGWPVDWNLVNVLKRLTLEHIDRIWPYAKRWYRNEETKEKLLGSYSVMGN